ncbi:MAG: DMT family transporter [Oscillospiraceae bacterium]|nr:DMT family transporter [Oscillospiraceae bacterium]
MKSNTKNTGALLIILAGIFWGSMGIFVRKLTEYGFTSIQITSVRLTLAAICFCLILLVRDPGGFRIRSKDLPLFLGLGLCSILFFTVCYFTAITMMSLSTAAILLYTSPIWVMLMSALFFREKTDGKKLLALVLAFIGCVLVSGLSGGGLTAAGLLIGLGSGFGYGLYSILGTLALGRYSPFTVTAYTFLIAAAGSWFIAPPAGTIRLLSDSPSSGALVLFCLLTAVVTAVVPFLLYTLGLRSTEAGKAAVLATVEPLVATLFGITVFSEPLTLSAGLGMLLILSAVILLNVRKGVL